MTGIDRYISELLFDHDCVILPGVGGFLTNYSGAHIHPVRHSFQPATRTVVFNANLSTNDGLLIDHVSKRKDISYQEASLVVNRYATEIKRDLESGQTLELKNVGTLRMGREDNIIFEPDESSNFLADAFGLPSFVSPAIKRETVRERLEKQLTPKPSAPQEQTKRNAGVLVNWAAGLAIPVTAALLLYMFNPGILDGPGKNFTSFVPALTIKPAKTVNEPATAEFAKFRSIPEKPEVVAEDPTPETEPEPNAQRPTPKAELTKYQIVVGAFSKESNAEKYVAELRSKNYDASIVGKSRNGLSRVSINGSDDKAEAIGMMDAIRESENPSAWLLRIR
jgi:cell division septation protein DedD